MRRTRQVHYNAATLCFGMSMTQPSPYKSTGGLARIARAFGYSMQGLGAAWRHEAAFRQETWLAVVLVPLGLWLGETAGERLLLAGMVVGVLIVELINSAIEALADAISTDHHPLLGRAKDIGSAAVLLMLLLTGAAWASVLIPRWA
ncbi:diacylglycerol kinase [Castellaniella caeni]